MSGAKKDNGPLAIGGEPRIDFLPPETKKRKEYRRQRRSLVALIIVILVICALGVGFSKSLDVAAQATLAAERQRTEELLAAQREYVEVRSAQADIATITQARLVGSATEILWADYLSDLINGLPEGATVTDLAVDSQSALEGEGVPDTLLRAPFVAQIGLGVVVPDLAVADEVLKYLKTVPAYVDVRTESVELDEGVYVMVVELHVNSDIFERRFFETPRTDDATTDDATTDDTTTDDTTTDDTTTDDTTTEDEN